MTDDETLKIVFALTLLSDGPMLLDPRWTVRNRGRISRRLARRLLRRGWAAYEGYNRVKLTETGKELLENINEVLI